MIQKHEVCFLPLHHMSSLVASRSALVKIFLPDLEFPTLAAENALACLEFDAQDPGGNSSGAMRNNLCALGVYTGGWGRHQRIPSATGYLATVSLCKEMGSTPWAHE